MAKWRRLLLPAALLAVVIALGLWYTRARSLDAIVGNAEVVSLSALYNEATLTITDGGSVADISVWQTGDGLTPDDPVGAALTAALEERRYRATLLNLGPAGTGHERNSPALPGSGQWGIPVPDLWQRRTAHGGQGRWSVRLHRRPRTV